RSQACAFPAGSWLQARRAFRCGMFRDRRFQNRSWSFPSIKIDLLPRTLSHRTVEFNHFRAAHSAIVAATAVLENKEETRMRLKLLSPGEMNDSQRQTYDESIAGKRGKPPAPMMAWLNSPDMARHATRLGEVLRYDTIFPAKLSETAILVTARHWTAHYEWYAHKRLALAGGMDPKIIDAIRDRRTPEFDDPKGKMIYDVAKSLHEGHSVEKGLYDEAVKLLGERGVVEVIGLCGYYTLVSMTLNTFEFGLPEGEVPELA